MDVKLYEDFTPYCYHNPVWHPVSGSCMKSDQVRVATEQPIAPFFSESNMLMLVFLLHNLKEKKKILVCQIGEIKQHKDHSLHMQNKKLKSLKHVNIFSS